jgi:hypothetical protein
MLSGRSKSQSIPYSIFVLLVISGLLLASCGLPVSIFSTPISPNPTSLAPLATPTSVPSSPTSQAPLDTPTSIPPSPTSQAPLDTPTSIPPSPTTQALLATPISVLPGPTPQPTATAAPVAGNIVFAPGTTATVVQGTLQPGQVATYTLGADQSQPMTLILDSPNNDITLGIFEPNGNMLLNPANKWTKWQVVLPKTELYTILVIAGGTAENFALTVKIAQIVNFASGTTSITLNGATVNGYPFDYALNCSAGQIMTVSLNVPSSTAYLDIFGGATSNLLLSDSARANTWTGILPQTQSYVVEVVPNNYQVVFYSLTISCTGVAGSSAVQSGDIIISPGSTAAVKHGIVGPGQVVTYTLQAAQYQILILDIGTVGSANKDVFLGVLYPDGTTFLSPSKKYIYWQWRLPQTGLYTIQVFGGATTENYELTVKIPRLVNFAADTSSITINSATEQGFVVSYVLYRSVGQTMTASLNVDPSIAYLDIFGLETGSLLSYSEKASSWTGVLPQTQQYIIEVIPRGGWIVGYSLTISFH